MLFADYFSHFTNILIALTTIAVISDGIQAAVVNHTTSIGLPKEIAHKFFTNTVNIAIKTMITSMVISCITAIFTLFYAYSGINVGYVVVISMMLGLTVIWTFTLASLVHLVTVIVGTSKKEHLLQSTPFQFLEFVNGFFFSKIKIFKKLFFTYTILGIIVSVSVIVVDKCIL